MLGEQLGQGRCSVVREHNGRMHVRGVDLTDELAAAPARWKHVERSVLVPPDGDDRGNPVLTGGHHRRYRGMLGAEARPRPRVDAHPSNR